MRKKNLPDPEVKSRAPKPIGKDMNGLLGIQCSRWKEPNG